MKYLRLLLLIGLIIPVYSYASNDIDRSCQRLQQDFEKNIYNRCYQYISGYLDGAIITDEAILKQFSSDYEHLSNFMQRVYKTRRRQDNVQLPGTILANFCLPEDVKREEIIASLIKKVDLAKNKLNHQIYNKLKQQYPCNN